VLKLTNYGIPGPIQDLQPSLLRFLGSSRITLPRGISFHWKPSVKINKPWNPRVGLFALFIGIDNYSHERPLRGAVSNAHCMRQYVQHMFKVPDDQIKELLNEGASRENIIAGFRALANNDFQKVKINWGDAILIFYAGHGDLIITPTGWSSGRRDNMIQSIVPQNFCKGEVEVIPDRTIGSLIDMIAKKHGDNIVRQNFLSVACIDVLTLLSDCNI